MHQRRDNVSKPHTETCRWIVELEDYQHWVKAPRGLLWIKGKPGAGKSTLMAFLYRQIMEPDTVKQGIALEFFFSARGDELQYTPLGMLRSLLNQLYRQDPHVRPGLNKIYQDKCEAFGGKDRRWDWQQPYLERILLENIVASAQRQPLIVFVDALDEAGSENAEHVAEYFHEINESIAEKLASGRICISCRHYPVSTTKHATEITVEDHNHDDIAAYVHHHLDLDLLLPTTAPDYSSWGSVIAYLISSANGLFQWVSLVVPLVKKGIHEGQSPESTREFLRTVPKKLEDVYEYILRNVIEVQYRSRAYLLFLWVCLAERPLSVTEMRYAISARDIVTSSRRIRCDEAPDFPKDDEQMERQIKALSGGLAEVVEMDRQSTTNAVQVVHQSVHDYILPEGLFLLAGLDKQTQRGEPSHTKRLSHENIIQRCQSLIYYSCLNYFVTENIKITDKSEFRVARKTWPLLQYAADHMFLHATNAGGCRSMNLENEIFLLQQATSKWVASSEYLHSTPGKILRRSATLLHVASAKNFPEFIDFLLSQGVLVDERDGYGNTALHYAAESGNTTITELLLLRGADTNIKNLRQKTPFTYAAGSGDKATMRIFLSKGLDVNEPVGMYGNALHQACICGLKDIVQMLLDAGADVNAACEEHGTAIQAASYYGPSNTRKIQRVVKLSDDLYAPNMYNVREKPCPSEEVFAEIIQLLLDAGADVNIKSGRFNTPLQAASDLGSMEKIQLLLEAGSEINIVGGKYGTALQAASYLGSMEIVQLLLSEGADTNIVGGEYGTALQAASYLGSMEIVQLLLSEGADTNIVGGKFGTALQAASYHDCEEIIRLLLNEKADVNIVGGKYGTALQVAAFKASMEIVQQLLDAGADVNIVGGKYGTALQAASCKGSTETIQLLLDAGADATIVGGKYGTPLLAAAQGQWSATEVVTLLLNYGADPSIPAQDGQTLAHIAARRGLSGIITMKSPDGVLLSRVDQLGRTPLHLAVYHGRLAIAATLTRYLHHPPGMDIYGRTPLDWARQDQAMIEKLHQRWPEFTFTADETRVNVLRESVRKLVKDILRNTNQQVSPGLFQLGRCLMFLKMSDDACVVFSMMTSLPNCIGAPQKYACCYSCGVKNIHYSRFICQTCAEMELCFMCMERRPRSNILRACEDHIFLEIPYPDIPYPGNPQPTITTLNDFQAWLQGLLVRFEEKNFGKAVYENERQIVESSIANNTLKPVFGYKFAAAILLGSSFYMLVNAMRHRQAN